MPELPEVETVRQVLLTQLIGKTITNVDVRYAKIIENVDSSIFIKDLTNEKFIDIKRKGKYLIFILMKHSLIVHLRMEGKFFFKESTLPIEKHEHLIFHLDHDFDLRYHDTRKFGRFVLLNTIDINEILIYPALQKLGPDANLEVDVSYLYQKLRSCKTSIKQALLDQTIICGLGNIYVDEVCFMAGLNPEIASCTINYIDAYNIVKAAKIVLDKAITLGGTTIRSYTSSLGVTGRFQNELLVHCRENEACQRCSTTILKTRVGGRGTYYCPNCQSKTKKLKIIGITGLIASGKTTVTNYLTGLGNLVIDADVINRELLDSSNPNNEAIISAVKELFPELQNDFNRHLLREIIFTDEERRIKLQDLLYPIIKNIIIERINQEKNDIIVYTKTKNVYLSAPLLIESKMDTLCDEVWFVDCPKDILVNHLMARDGMNKTEAIQAINLRSNTVNLLKQLKINKIPYQVILNNQDINSLIQKIDNLI